MAQAKTSRPGRTEKISISLDRGDLAWLKQRARRHYGGNVSAVAAEGVRRLREEEGRAALVTWLGEAAAMSPTERDAVRAALTSPAEEIGTAGTRRQTRRRRRSG